MSSAVLRVELPAYSHSFQVQVPPTSTIRDVKQEITRTCPGSPLPDGQRLVFKGRFLSDDEKVEDVWKSPDDSRVVHLAVHPSAWTSTPPSLHNASNAPSPAPQPAPSAHRSSTSQPRHSSHPPSNAPGQSLPTTDAAPFPPIAYIQYLHNVALSVLSGGAMRLPPQPAVAELEAWRLTAMEVYRNRGWTWPAVFDAPFPSGSPDQGVVYQAVMIEGLPYLSLATPNATPTEAQNHALNVISHTFAILSMANDPMLYVSTTPYSASQNTPTTNLNQRLQELGFPPLRLAPNQVPRNANDANQPNRLGAPVPAGGAEIRAIPVRALLVPLLMLAFRTVLLLYFFSPSKRPLFGILLSLWVMYEAWAAMRLVINDGNERPAEAAGANPAAARNAPGRQGGGPVQAVPRANRVQMRSPIQAVIDGLAMMNISYEDALLESDTQAPPPSVLQKAKIFITLFVLTLYPAAWDRRRTALRQREGRIRTEATAREAALTERAERESAGTDAPARSAEEEARAKAREQIVVRHERRPAWLKQYVQRVQYSEWVDDP